MISCHKFHSCNAPLCPLDLKVGSHRSGEPVCLGARELVKTNGVQQVNRYFGADVATRLQAALPEYRKAHSDINARLTRGATTGSKLKPING